MKNSTYLIILLALGLVFVSYKWVNSSSAEPVTSAPASDIALENIMTRSSVRSYSDRPVSAGQIDTLL
ncbi:MAG: nitroreductase family protein, partial [Muribaculaceae bacterium]|nr:nitroreductase family protein [Muribaculaceae bacterium]